jgi:hypothetical protein
VKRRVLTTKKAIRALDQSIEHWERLASGKRRAGEHIGSEHCALCKLFLFKLSFGVCSGCPIAEDTGLRWCAGTPFKAAVESEYAAGLDSTSFRAAARRELRYLRGLLKRVHVRPSKSGVGRGSVGPSRYRR